MIIAISIVGGLGLLFMCGSIYYVIAWFAAASSNDPSWEKMITFDGYRVLSSYSCILFIAVYVMALFNDPGLATIIVGAFAMLLPVYLVTVHRYRVLFEPLFMLWPGLQIALFVLALV